MAYQPINIEFPDGETLEIAVEVETAATPPTNQLKPHTVTFGTAKATQFAVTLTPGTVQPAPTPPANTVLPSIAGGSVEGDVLTGSPGTWTEDPTLTYQWERSGSAIAEANSLSYILQGADVGATLTLAVTATANNLTATATSKPTAVITAPPPPAPTVTITTEPAGATGSVTWATTGEVTTTTATVDGEAVSVTGSSYSFSNLATGPHTFIVTVTGPGGDNSATATWTVAPVTNYLFDDEFNGAAGSLPNTTLWTYDLGNWPDNDEQEDYTDLAANGSLDGDGHFVITAIKNGATPGWPYTSCRLKSIQTFKYGRLDVSAKVPKGAGLWPSAWMVEESNWPAGGEADLFEILCANTTVCYQTAHGPLGGSDWNSNPNEISNGVDYSEAFHEYSMIWTEGQVQFLIDDVVTFTNTPANMPGGGTWPFDTTPGMNIILNMAVGNTGSFGGAPNADTVFPASVEYDYVRFTGNAVTPPANTLTITTKALPAAVAEATYTATLEATGGTPPYTWENVGGLPYGLAIAANTGVITGAVTSGANDYVANIEVTDSKGATATAPVTLTVTPSATPPPPPPPGTLSTPGTWTLAWDSGVDTATTLAELAPAFNSSWLTGPVSAGVGNIEGVGYWGGQSGQLQGPAAIVPQGSKGLLLNAFSPPNSADNAKVPAEYQNGDEYAFISTAGLLNIDVGGKGTEGAPGKVIDGPLVVRMEILLPPSVGTDLAIWTTSAPNYNNSGGNETELCEVDLLEDLGGGWQYHIHPPQDNAGASDTPPGVDIATWCQTPHTFEWLFQASGLSLYLDGENATWFNPTGSGPWAPALDIAMYIMIASAKNAPLTVLKFDIWT